MFGYLRLENRDLPVEIRRYYRQQYCSLCHALWNFYGYLPRFLLSYDMTFAAVLLDLKAQIDFREKKPICYFKKEIASDRESWKRLAAVSLLLAAEKLRDDVADEGSLSARCILLSFSGPICRAEQDYPILSACLKQGFQRMSSLEQKRGNVEQLAEAFSSILIDGVNLMFPQSEPEIAILRHVAQWIYFMDAVDDLDKDIRKGTYNPFLGIARSRADLVKYHSDVLAQFICRQRDSLRPWLQQYPVISARTGAIVSILQESIPWVTGRVLLGERPHRPTSILVKVMESKWGITFA